MMSDKFEELHWFCSESGDREAFVYCDSMGYRVKMVEVETGGRVVFMTYTMSKRFDLWESILKGMLRIVQKIGFWELSNDW